MSMALKDIFRRRTEDQTVQVENNLLKAIFGVTQVDKQTALAIPQVSDCVDFIAGIIAGLPVRLTKEINGVIQPVNDDGRVKMLNGDTGDTLDAYQMKKAMLVDYFMGKGGFAYIDRVGNTFTGLHYIDESQLSVNKNSDPIFKAGYYTVVENVDRLYPYQLVKVLRNTKDGFAGQSIVREVAKALETAYNSISTQNKIFKRDGMKKGFLEAEAVITKDAADKLKQDWSGLYNGGDNTILLNKGLKFTPANMSVAEMQLIEARRLLDEEIRNIFHIKDNLNDTFNCALKPVIKQLETALNRDLLLESEKLHFRFYLDTSDVFTATEKDRYETYNAAIKGGYMSINEVREKEHLNKIKGLDLYNLGLSSALFNPKDQQIIIPNMAQTVGVDGKEQNIDENN